MANRSAQYWQKRSEQILIDNEKLALNYEKEMAKIYEQVKLDTQRDLQAFYQRYANETGLSLAEVRKRLSPAELKTFKTQQKLYLDKVNKLIKQGADLNKYAETLKELSARAYVSRLQEIQNNLNSEIMLLNGEQQVRLTNVLKDSYLQGYFKTQFALQQGLGFGYSFTAPNNDDVLKVLRTPWNGNNYSNSIWRNKTQLTNWLNTDLARHFASGSSIGDITQDLGVKLNTNFNAARRLVRTEVNYISNQSTMDAYENSNVVDKYEILATLDSRTSEICRDMDGRVFKVTEKKVAINMPPFHVNCRTTTVPHFEDDDLEDMERAARDDDGKYYTVPAHMDYSQWNEKYGQGAKVNKQGKTVVAKEEKLVEVQKANERVKGSQIPVEERNYVDLQQQDVDKWSEEVVPNLTSKQKQAVEDYTGMDYYTMNGMLRGKITSDPQIMEKVDIIRSTMSEIPQDTRLFRTMNKYDFLKTFGDDLLVELQQTDDIQTWMGKLGGKVFKDKAFQSTSWTPKSSYIEGRTDSRSILFRIKTPKGTKALPVEKFSLVEGEKEIILNSGNSYVITAIKKTEVSDGDLIIIDCLLREGV